MTKRKVKDEIIPISMNLDVIAEMKAFEHEAARERSLAKLTRAKGKKQRHTTMAAKFARRATTLKGFLKLTAGLSFADIPQTVAA